MVKYVRGHQGRKKRKDQYTVTGNLNTQAERITRKNDCIPKSTHIRNTPIIVYINKHYTPNNVREEI